MLKEMLKMTPCIYSYDDYRAFLADVFETSKEKNSLLSHRAFARKINVSASFLTMILKGQRNLSSQGILKFARGLSLNKEESDFFHDLVLFNQATRTDEKDFHFQNMAKSRKFKELRYLEKAQFDYCSKWYYSTIRELIQLDGFKEDPQWIAGQLSPRISPKEAQEALNILQELQLIKRDSQGHLKAVDAVVSSGEKIRSLAMKKYHIDMLTKAEQSIDRIDRGERDLSAMTFSMSKEDIQMVKDEIMHFRRALISKLVNKQTRSDRVYQINIQLFPLTKILGEI